MAIRNRNRPSWLSGWFLGFIITVLKKSNLSVMVYNHAGLSKPKLLPCNSQ
jgi:hypothetical protein